MKLRRWTSDSFLCFAVACVLLALPFPTFAATTSESREEPRVPSQRELNGFLLGQHQGILQNAFGTPMHDEKTTDGWRYLAYALDKKSGGYMAFKFTADDQDEIYSIQIAGGAGTEMQAFNGLRLGDSEVTILGIFGEPSAIKRNQELDLDLYEYEGRNYSFEVDSKGRLSSIQIFGYEGFGTSTGKTLPSMEHLYEAVEAEDPGALLSLLSATVEIYRADTTTRFMRAAHLEIADPSSQIAIALRGPKRSIREVAKSGRAQGDGQIRILEAKPHLAFVYKFPESKLLDEVVFVFEAGAWRVWEIQFRQ